MTGSEIKQVLEQTCDHLFNPDPYQQHGSDMLRVGGMHYTCDPNKSFGSRISNLTIGNKSIDASRTYKVASWGEGAKGGQPVWEVVATWLKDKKTIHPTGLNVPHLADVKNNPGVSL
jgi:sulfur-oxidizing protein SoxB